MSKNTNNNIHKKNMEAKHQNESKDTIISVNNLSVAYHKKPVLWDIHVDIPKGKLVAIVGPNGAGKSTFMKSLLDIVPKISGNVQIMGRPYAQVKEFVSYIPQRKTVDWDYPITVHDLVAMGLYPTLKWYQRFSKKQNELIWATLEQVDLLPYARRQISQLSGGQQQRAFMARSLIQNAEICFMDEPFAGIDAASEKAIFSVIDTLQKQKKTIIIVHHNLSMIKEHFDYIIMLNLRLIAHGDVKTTFTDENLDKTYMGRLTLLEDAARQVVEKKI